MAVKQRSLRAHLTRPYRWRSKNNAVHSISPLALQSIWNRQPSEQRRGYLVNRPLGGEWVPLLVTVPLWHLCSACKGSLIVLFCKDLEGVLPPRGRCPCYKLYIPTSSPKTSGQLLSCHTVACSEMYYSVWQWIIIKISLQCNEKFNNVRVSSSEWVFIL